MQFSERFYDALAYACRLHAAQVRKGTDVPYAAHLLGVAAIVLEHGGNEDEAIAALLHDAVEDQGGAATRDEISHRYGQTVAEIVDGCTDAVTTPKPPWRDRKDRYLANLTGASHSVRLVSAADKLHNVRSLQHDYRLHGETLSARFTGGREGTLWYYRAVVDTLVAAEATPLAQALQREVAALERLVSGE